MKRKLNTNQREGPPWWSVWARGLVRGLYGGICIAVGFVFTAIHGMELSWSQEWPALAWMLTFGTVSTGLWEAVREQGYRPGKEKGGLWPLPLLWGGGAALYLRGAAGWMLLAHGLVYGLLIWAVRRGRLCRLYRQVGGYSLRYALILPVVTTVLLNLLLGALFPLARQGQGIALLFFLTAPGYLMVWAATRKVQRPWYWAPHLALLGILLGLALYSFAGLYIFRCIPRWGWLGLTLKGYFLGLFGGIYLAVPQACVTAWKQRGEICTEQNFQDRMEVSHLLLILGIPLVCWASIWVEFSTVFVMAFTLGTTALLYYTHKPHRWMQAGVAVFIAGGVALLLLEFSGLMPTWAYSLPQPDLTYPSVFIAAWEVLSRKFYRAEPGENQLPGTKNMGQLHGQLVLLTQMTVVVGSGLGGYSPRVQMVLIAAGAALLEGSFFRLLLPWTKGSNERAAAPPSAGPSGRPG